MRVSGAGGGACWWAAPPGVEEPAVVAALREAVGAARRHGGQHLLAAVDASAPLGGVLVQAMRGMVGTAAESMTMRRAGASVMVDLVLLPAPRGAPSRSRSAPHRGRRSPRGVLSGHRRRVAVAGASQAR